MAPDQMPTARTFLSVGKRCSCTERPSGRIKPSPKPCSDRPTMSRRGANHGGAEAWRPAPRGRSAEFDVHHPVHLERRQGHVRQSPRRDHTALLTNTRQLPTLHAESTFVLCPTAQALKPQAAVGQDQGRAAHDVILQV